MNDIFPDSNRIRHPVTLFFVKLLSSEEQQITHQHHFFGVARRHLNSLGRSQSHPRGLLSGRFIGQRDRITDFFFPDTGDLIVKELFFHLHLVRCLLNIYRTGDRIGNQRNTPDDICNQLRSFYRITTRLCQQ